MFFLDRAIELTKQAYNNHAKELDETEREMERLIATIRNNLASYIATLQKQKGRVAEGDRLLAEGCARYIKARIHTFPDKAATWELTLKEVRESFPDADL